MRKFFLLICFSRIASVCFAQTIHVDDPSTYLPEGIGKIYLGISIADFKVNKDTSAMERDISFGYLYTGFKESFTNSPIVSVKYKFDTPQSGKNTDRPLYELSIEFSNLTSADDFVTKKFTSMYRISDVAEKEWFLGTNKDYFLLVRKNGTKITIAAMMSGTEWGFD